MATFQKRKNSWRATVRRMGKYASATFDTKVEADAWATVTEARFVKGLSAEAVAAALAMPEAGVPAVEALQRYSDAVPPTKRGGRWEQVRIKAMIREDQLFRRSITGITGPDLAEWRDKRLKKVSGSTVNRELCLLSSVFTFAMRECRIAHLLCELGLRIERSGRRKRTEFDFPLTQQHLADALGLTPVHVNRTLKMLRDSGLVTIADRHVRVHAWDRLEQMADFNPAYLLL
jgi:hypothetical protein